MEGPFKLSLEFFMYLLYCVFFINFPMLFDFLTYKILFKDKIIHKNCTLFKNTMNVLNKQNKPIFDEGTRSILDANKFFANT